MRSQSRSSAPRGHRRKWLIALAVLLVLLVVGRLLAPMLIERVVEASLEDMPDGYRGTLEGVDVRTLEAEIALLGLRIEKKNGRIPVPFLHAKELVIGAVRDSWKLRSTLRMVEPVISKVDAESEALTQSGPTFDPAQLRKQLPFELLAVYVDDGQFHFRNFQTKPDLDVYLHDLDVAWEQLVGCLPPGSSSCRSKLRATADVLKGGKLELDGTFERSPEAALDVRATLRDLRAAQLSPLLRHYAKIDVQGGEIGLDATYRRRGKSHSARIVPRVRALEVMGGAREDTRFGRELGAALAAGWLERNAGEKAIELKSKPNGGMDYEVVDLPKSNKDRE